MPNMTFTSGNDPFPNTITNLALAAAQGGSGNSFAGYGNVPSSTGSVPATTSGYNQQLNPATLNPPAQTPSTSGWSGSTSVPTQTGQVPWWLNPNTVNSNIRELKTQFKNAGSAFDVSGTIANLQNVLNQNYSTGLTNADSAAREATARAEQEGGFVNSSLLRGQAAYDAFQQKEQGTLQAGQYGDQAKQAEFNAKSDLAKTIATMRSQYAQQLAAFSLNKDQQQMSREEFYQTLGSTKNQFEQSLAFQQSQLANRGAQLSGAGSGGNSNALASLLHGGLPTIFSSSGTQPNFAGMDVNRNDAADTYLSYLKKLGLI